MKIWISVVITILLVTLANPSSAYPVTGTFEKLDGSDQAFSTFEGRPVMIEAMQTTCSHCNDPAHRSKMNTLLDSFGASVSFVLLTVNSQDDVEKVTDFMDRFDIKWLAGFDRNRVMANQFGVTGTPTTILLDAAGSVYANWEGHKELDIYVGALNTLLDTEISVEDTFVPGGSQGPSVIEAIFSNQFFQGGLVIFLLLFIYLRTTKPKTI